MKWSVLSPVKVPAYLATICETADRLHALHPLESSKRELKMLSCDLRACRTPYLWKYSLLQQVVTNALDVFSGMPFSEDLPPDMKTLVFIPDRDGPSPDSEMIADAASNIQAHPLQSSLWMKLSDYLALALIVICRKRASEITRMILPRLSPPPEDSWRFAQKELRRGYEFWNQAGNAWACCAYRVYTLSGFHENDIVARTRNWTSEEKLIGCTPLVVPWFVGPETTPCTGSMAELKASIHFLNEEIVDFTSHRPPTKQRRMLRKKRLPIWHTKVVTLRRRYCPKSQIESGKVDWSCQWVVSGHWRKQWYPSKKKNKAKWIEPYIKGPEDKPLREPTHTIYRVAR